MEEQEGIKKEESLKMVYPSPLLSHVDVSTSPVAFLDTLRGLHSVMGTRFMIPVIGGKELNLHQLYVQVTQRGGLEKVILERRWREVIAAFNFPPTTTSASFVLRKYYLSLLYHYEQVYFFGTQGPLVAPPAILQTKTPSKLEQSPDQSADPTMRKKRAVPPRRNKVVPAPFHILQGLEYVSTDAGPQAPTVRNIIATEAPIAGNILATDVNGVGGSFSVATALPSKSTRTVVPAPSHIVQGNEYVSSNDAPQAPTPVENIPATDVNGVAGFGSVATALILESTQAVVVPATPHDTIKGELAATSYIAQTTTTVESKPATDVNGVAGSYSVENALTSGESTPTGEIALPLPFISPTDGIPEATPFVPASITPTFGETASTGAHNLTVSGTIDGKFENGYFVTVGVGTQMLHGVLYHVPPLAEAYSSLHQANHPPPGPSSCSAKSPSNATDPYIPQTRSVQRCRKYKKYRAPDHPKTNRSAYNFFFAEKHAKLKIQYPHKEREYSKMIGASWSKLTEEERRVYDDYARRDKERYRRELQEYNERKKLVQPRGVLKIRGANRETEAAKSKEVEMAEASKVKDGC